MKKNVKENTYEWTNNRAYFNKLHKLALEQRGEIRCSYCGYHGGENSTTDWYVIHPNGSGRHPSWKLVSKNRKQWMKKPYHIEEDFDLEWSAWSGNTKPTRESTRRFCR
jgi:hypothetical protein